jgi:hypothetical protein
VPHAWSRVPLAPAPVSRLKRSTSPAIAHSDISFAPSRFPPLAPHRFVIAHLKYITYLDYTLVVAKDVRIFPHVAKQVHPRHKCRTPPARHGVHSLPSKQLPSLVLGRRLPCLLWAWAASSAWPQTCAFVYSLRPPRPPLRTIAPIILSGYALPHSLRNATPPSLAGDHGAGAAPEPPHGV